MKRCNSHIQKKGWELLINQLYQEVFSITRIPRFQPKCIRTNFSNSTYKVKLEYFNGQTWIENKLLIDTGASQCHYIPLPIPVISISEYNFVTYDRRKSTLNQKSKIMMKTPNSILLQYWVLYWSLL